MIFKEEAMKKAGLSPAEFSFLAYIVNGGNENVITSLLRKGLIGKSYQDGEPKEYFVSPKGRELLDSIAIDSNNPDKEKYPDEFIEELRSIFPEGTKEGTNKYWRGNRGEIKKRLQSFPLYFGTYSNEEILEATRRYVSSFMGDYTYMRLLPYFIWKVESQDGEKIRTSDLSSFLENKDIKEDYEGLC